MHVVLFVPEERAGRVLAVHEEAVALKAVGRDPPLADDECRRLVRTRIRSGSGARGISQTVRRYERSERDDGEEARHVHRRMCECALGAVDLTLVFVVFVPSHVLHGSYNTILHVCNGTAFSATERKAVENGRKFRTGTQVELCDTDRSTAHSL